MYQWNMPQTVLAFKPKLYKVWTILVALLFGAGSLFLYIGLLLDPLKKQSLWCHCVVGALLIGLVWLTASAPYSYAACVVSDEGIALPEPTYPHVFGHDSRRVELFLPFILLCIFFLPNYTEPIEWEAIQSARIEKGFFGTSLVLDMGEYKRKIRWPLADMKGFQKAVFRYAPFQNPLFQLMRSF